MIIHAPDANCKWRTKHYCFVITNTKLFLLSQHYNTEEGSILVI